MKLNLGSGPHRKEGFVNVDVRDVAADVFHDLNVLPYPFADNSIEHIEMSHVLEHLKEPFAVMWELHRILQPGGTLKITVPHFSRGFTHAEHEHGFDISFPLYFDSKNFPDQFYGVEFRSDRTELHWLSNITFRYLKILKLGRMSLFFLPIFNKIFNTLANHHQMFCSRIWCFWVGGFEEIEFNMAKNVQ